MKRTVWLLLLLTATCCGDSDGSTDTHADMAVDALPTDLGQTPDAAKQDVTTAIDSPRDQPTVKLQCVPDSKNCYPIVLAHGFAADTGLLEFFQVPDGLQEAGFSVYESEVSPYNSVEVRSAQLAANIDEALDLFDVSKVNIVAHSMGGLDARYAISVLGYADKIASLTTVSTPHRGTNLGGIFDGGIADALILEAVLKLIGGGREVANDPDLRAALHALSKEAAIGFNRRVLNDPNIYYQSWAGLSNVAGIGRPKDDEVCGSYWRDQNNHDVMDILLTPLATLTSEGTRLIPHDGLVSVESAKWGNFRGCIRADHIDEIGQVFDFFPDLITGFYHVDFYTDVAADLAERGF